MSKTSRRGLGFSFGVLAALAMGCPPSRTASDWPDDPKTVEDVHAKCVAAGKRLDELKCQAARPDFVDFCEYELSEGIPLHPQCLATIKTCNDVRKC